MTTAWAEVRQSNHQLHGRSRSIALAAALVLAVLAFIVVRELQLCGGHLGYPMDDTYIHMAMAKNFALHGVWGVTRYAFSSSTSSPLYTLILAACYVLFGVREVTPLLLNLAAAAGVMVWCEFVLRRAGLSFPRIAGSLCLLAFAIPLPILAISGMEHLFQILFVLIFAHLVSTALASRRLDPAPFAWLLGATALMAATRYESVFLVFIAALLFAFRRMWAAAIAVSFACALPLVAYGLVSKAHGWYALPTSLLLKANVPSHSTIGALRAFLWGLLLNCAKAPHIVLLVCVAAALAHFSFRKYRTIWTYSQLGLILFVGTAIPHMMFARVGWYFRYEAYLVALGGLVCLISAHELYGSSSVTYRWRWPAVLLLSALALALGFRTARAIYLTPTGIRNIYDQQYQMGLFVHTYFDHDTVVLNDIGAVCFLSDANVLDVVGLGSVQAAAASFHRTYSRPWLRTWAHDNHAKIALIYAHIGPPQQWKPVATWTIPDNWIAGRSWMKIYEIDPSVDRSLTADLRQFQARLPAGVKQDLW